MLTGGTGMLRHAVTEPSTAVADVPAEAGTEAAEAAGAAIRPSESTIAAAADTCTTLADIVTFLAERLAIASRLRPGCHHALLPRSRQGRTADSRAHGRDLLWWSTKRPAGDQRNHGPACISPPPHVISHRTCSAGPGSAAGGCRGCGRSRRNRVTASPVEFAGSRISPAEFAASPAVRPDGNWLPPIRCRPVTHGRREIHSFDELTRENCTMKGYSPTR